MIEREEFEGILDEAGKRLNVEVRETDAYREPKAFELRVRDVLVEEAEGRGVKVDPTFHPHAFPDIKINGYGVEVKTVIKDSWLSVGNSVFEGMRDDTVSVIYVVFGKFGGMPAVRWGRYEESITHVRISHAPRFVLEMTSEKSLFSHMDVTYNQFCDLSADEKMRHIREYSRSRLRPGERLWWLEDEREDEGLPVAVRLYMALSKEEKIKLRAEGALLFPQIVMGSRQRGKYKDVAMYYLTQHGVLASQTRDLFSAGSAAGKGRGGIYTLRGLQKIEEAMKQAAATLPDELFVEYWGESVPPEKRIATWLRKADKLAKGWKPSDELFKDVPKEPEATLFPAEDSE